MDDVVGASEVLALVQLQRCPRPERWPLKSLPHANSVGWKHVEVALLLTTTVLLPSASLGDGDGEDDRNAHHAKQNQILTFPY